MRKIIAALVLAAAVAAAVGVGAPAWAGYAPPCDTSKPGCSPIGGGGLDP